jgi:NPCBM/NEW2 domain
MRTFVATSAIALGLATLPVTAAHAGTTWIVGIHASATTINVGQKVVFTGRVRPAHAAAGKKVILQERFEPGAPWRDSAKDKLNRRGKYHLSDEPHHNTTHSYRVVMPANSKHARGVSKTVKVTVYDWTPLTQLDWVNDDSMQFGPVDINGTTYDHSVYAPSWATRQTSSIEFNLDHQCNKLRSTFGINDDSSTGGQAEVGVLADGTSVYDHTFDLGQSENKTVALATPLKIKLLATDTSTAPGTFGLGAFGNAEAHCTQ